MTRHYCKACAEQLGLIGQPGDWVILFPWEEEGPFSLSVAGIVSQVGPNVVVLSVRRSSHFTAGFKLHFKPSYIPPGMREAGTLLSFNAPAESVGGMLLEPLVVSNGGDRSGAKGPDKGGDPAESGETKYANNGLGHLLTHVTQLLAAGQKRAGVEIATLDGQCCILLIHDGGRTVLNIWVDRVKHEEQEERVFRFFQKLGMQPFRDELCAHGGVAGSLRRWLFEIPQDASAICSLCRAIFSDLFGVSEEQGLRFSPKSVGTGR